MWTLFSQIWGTVEWDLSWQGHLASCELGIGEQEPNSSGALSSLSCEAS